MGAEPKWKASMLRRFLKDESGATAVEYGLIVAVLSAAIITGAVEVADGLRSLWGDSDSELRQAFN